MSTNSTNSTAMNRDFENKRILITGAGKGIGRELVAFLTKRGARVVAVSRTEADLVSLRAECGCEIVRADLSDAGEAARAATEALAGGRVDFLVNNAGISFPQAFLETSVDAFDRTLAVNTRAALVVSQVIAREWVRVKWGGAIVNVSSQASPVAVADHAAYCASKAALDALTRVMALELAPRGIRVNSVNPTVTLTPMGEMAWGDPAKSGPMLAKIPLGRFAKPHEVASVVAFLLSDAAAMVNGVCLPVDGGFLAT